MTILFCIARCATIFAYESPSGYKGNQARISASPGQHGARRDFCRHYDIGKRDLDVYVIPSDDHFIYENSQEGIDKLLERLAQIKPKLVVMKPTGGLEMLLAAALVAAGFEVSVINPGRPRNFARATGSLAKNDHVDAKALALFGKIIRLEVRPL